MWAKLSIVLVLSSPGCGATPTEPTRHTTSALVASERTAEDVRERWRAGSPIRVLVLGNSVSLGCCADGWERVRLTPEGHLTAASQADDSGGGVVTQLRRLVRSRNPTSVVVNESGDGYDVARAVAWLINRILPANPSYDVAFLPLQVNDSNRGAPMPLYVTHMQTIIDRLKAAGVVPVLVKENDIYSLPEVRFGTPIASFMEAVDQLAARNNLSVVDGYTPFHQAVLAGGGIERCGLFSDNELHPNQAGHDLLFRAYERWFNR